LGLLCFTCSVFATINDAAVIEPIIGKRVAIDVLKKHALSDYIAEQVYRPVKLKSIANVREMIVKVGGYDAWKYFGPTSIVCGTAVIVAAPLF
jgi:hypothetical protein